MINLVINARKALNHMALAQSESISGANRAQNHNFE